MTTKQHNGDEKNRRRWEAQEAKGKKAAKEDAKDEQIGAKERIHTEEKWRKLQVKKAYIKKLKREEQLRIQKMERAALRLIQKQEAERIMRKEFRDAEEKRKLKEAQKRKEDAEMLRQLLSAAGRSRPMMS